MASTVVKLAHECEVSTHYVTNGTIVRCDECGQRWRRGRYEWTIYPWWTRALHPRRRYT